MMAQKRLEKMKTNLNLTDAPGCKNPGLQKQFNGTGKSDQGKFITYSGTKERTIHEPEKSRKESMNSILTAEQLKKKEEMRNSRINDMKNKRTNKES